MIMATKFENIAKIKAGLFDLAVNDGKAEALRVLASLRAELENMGSSGSSSSDYIGPGGNGVSQW